MQHEKVEIDEEALKPWLGGRSFADAYAEYDEAGYVIIENVLSAEKCDHVRSALSPYFTKLGRNDFEGFKSNRVYALLGKAPEVFGPMAMHPLALAFAEKELGRSCLLSAMLAINLHPGETVQDWHHDDAHLEVPLPRAPFGVSTFWAIDAMTEDNGATQVIPRSHLWEKAEVSDPDLHQYDQGAMDVEHDPKPHPDAVKATMPAGSFMAAKGTLWHRGGANKTDDNRLIVTPQYCSGWARQLENMILATSRDVTRSLPQRVRELMGYNIHGGFMGYVDGGHPEKVLDGAN